MSTQRDHVQVDVFIAGSGPVGATFARKLVEGGRSVAMVDAGAKLSARPGAHLKNSAIYQRNIDLFAPVIRGHLSLVSIPTNNNPVVTLDPAAFAVDMEKHQGFVHNNQNPEQSPYNNLGAAAVTYAVGGMATHWTCATPRHHPLVERTNLIPDAEWDRLYAEGERLLNTHTDAFEHSIRHQTVRDLLREEYTELEEPYHVQNLPLAVERREDDPTFVHWSGTDNVFGPLCDDDYGGRFKLFPEVVCRRLGLSPDGSRVEYADVQDLATTRVIRVEADTFVVACNAIGTPQVLWESGIRPLALGRYLNEQPVAFCQIVLHQHRVDGIELDERFADRVRIHREERPTDPIPIPTHDPEPNVWIPVSDERPWHCQIHRDAFHYGDIAPNIDGRLVVDLRWFGMTQPRADNRVTFSERHVDILGLPQPTFEWSITDVERQEMHRMMKDMLRAAGALGGFLPGSEPQFVEPGLPLHFAGTVRMGEDPETSVCDTNSKVHGLENLYVGGNGVIPRAQASNPTLTSVAFALKSSAHILGHGA